MRDVRVIERGQDLRFAPEARKTIGIIGHRRQQHLDRDVAIQLRVARAMHLAHTAYAQGREDVVRAESSAGGNGDG